MSEVESTANEDTSQNVETIDNGLGNSPASFDELEAVHSFHDNKKKDEAKEKKNEIKSEVKKELEKKEAKAKKPAGEGEQKEVPEDGEDEAETAETKAPAVKTLKVKAGDQDVELPVNVEIPVKINGQDAKVTLDELRNNYAGKTEWSRRFGELDRNEKKFTQTKDTFITRAKDILATSEKDGLAGLTRLAEIAGHDPIKWRQDFLNNLMPDLEKYRDLTDDERNALEQQHQLEFYKQRDESHRKATEDQQAIKALETKVADLQQTHQIDQETFAKTFVALEELQQKGQLGEQWITPEMVVEVAVAERRVDAVSATLKELNLNLSEAQQDQAIRDILEVAKSNADLSMDDLKDITKQVWGDQKAQTLSRKIAKTQSSERKSQKTPANPQHEAISFDDL